MATAQAQSLTELAANIATAGAIEYLRVHDAGPGVDFAALREALVRTVNAALPQALSDAREALDAHMGEIAETTFRASMVLAGIQAAKLALS